MSAKRNPKSLRHYWYEVIFHADTKAGKTFDIILLVSILLSVFVVILDSVNELHLKYHSIFFYAEWFFTILFTIEYVVRIYVSRNRIHYVRSFYGIIDLLSILPTYFSLMLTGSHFLLVIRILRLLRVFRILKLSRYLRASEVLAISLKRSRYKITVFFEVVLTLVVIMGSLMYLIEGPENGFTSIPKSIYWAIVTLTTVGFGDITPQTVLGQVFASLIMILGYSIIAVPTGIISSEMYKAEKKSVIEVACTNCKHTSHDADAMYCKSCGTALPKQNQ
ncbi:MAG: ion transporter [Bacteroidales bacterium]